MVPHSDKSHGRNCLLLFFYEHHLIKNGINWHRQRNFPFFLEWNTILVEHSSPYVPLKKYNMSRHKLSRCIRCPLQSRCFIWDSFCNIVRLSKWNYCTLNIALSHSNLGSTSSSRRSPSHMCAAGIEHCLAFHSFCTTTTIQQKFTWRL